LNVIAKSFVSGIAAAAAVAALTVAPSPAQATPAFAQQTGLACQQCHVSLSQPQQLTARGKKFKDNGNKIPKGN
jgi:hypothetical protein